MYEMYVALRMNRAKHDWVKMMQEEIWRRFGRAELMAYTRQDICQVCYKRGPIPGTGSLKTGRAELV